MIERFASGGPFEDRVGYARTVRAGDLVLVSGCTAMGEDGIVRGLGDVYAQTHETFDAAERALFRAGATLAALVRTRIYLIDITHWEAVGRAHAERVGEHRPASTMVQVPALIDPRIMVEIEFEAYLPRD